MKTIFIPENHLSAIFNSLTLKDDSRAVLHNVVVRFDHSYTNFMYSIFSAYSNVYVSLMDEHCELSREEIRDAFNKLVVLRREIKPGNIFVADKLDLLYGVSCTGDTRNTKFKDFMYEDMCSRLENLLGVQKALDYMEDTFEAIEYVTGMIEGNLMAVAQSTDDEDGNMLFYLDIVPEGLLFIII